MAGQDRGGSWPTSALGDHTYISAEFSGRGAGAPAVANPYQLPMSPTAPSPQRAKDVISNQPSASHEGRMSKKRPPPMQRAKTVHTLTRLANTIRTELLRRSSAKTRREPTNGAA